MTSDVDYVRASDQSIQRRRRRDAAPALGEIEDAAA